MLANAKYIYALDMWTVEKRTNGWYFSKSAYHGDKHEWRGPYSSEMSVTPDSLLNGAMTIGDVPNVALAFHGQSGNDAKCGYACHTTVAALDCIFTAYPKR